jgi:hypothetical protein
MKKALVYANIIILVTLGVGFAELMSENYTLRGEIKAINKTFTAKNGTTIPPIQKDASNFEGLEQRITAIEDFLSLLSGQTTRDTAETKDRISQMEKMVANNLFGTLDFDKGGDGENLTKEAIQELVQKELQKTSEQRRPERKTVTFDELSKTLELTYEQTTGLKKIIIENQERMVQFFFGITDTAKMQELKTKIANAESNPEIKKELAELIATNMRNRPPSPQNNTFRNTESQVRELLGNEKYTQYRNYEVTVESELTGAIKIIRESFPMPGGPPR